MDMGEKEKSMIWTDPELEIDNMVFFGSIVQKVESYKDYPFRNEETIHVAEYMAGKRRVFQEFVNNFKNPEEMYGLLMQYHNKFKAYILNLNIAICGKSNNKGSLYACAQDRESINDLRDNSIRPIGYNLLSHKEDQGITLIEEQGAIEMIGALYRYTSEYYLSNFYPDIEGATPILIEAKKLL